MFICSVDLKIREEPMDAIRELAEFAWETGFSHIPEAVLEHERLILLDTLGVALAGAGAPGCGEVMQLMKDYGGTPESSFFVFEGKVPAKHAALVNAMCIQALDYDDSHDDGCCHTHCACLPPALAMAEREKGITGRDILEALILAVEVESRIGAATLSSLSFTRTGTLGYFGAAVAAAKIMRLDFPQFLDALGIAYAQVSTTLQSNMDGALVKRMHPGFAAQAGVFSCQLAQRGITGARNILEGPYGYFQLYERGAYNPEPLTRGLGTDWEIMRVGLKNYPCARDMHAAVDAALELCREGLDTSRIRDIEVSMPDSPFRVSGRPYDSMTGHVVVEALLNGPYCIAAAMLRGGLGLEDFTEPRIHDPAVAELARKIHVVRDDSVPPKQKMPMTVRVTLDDGTCREKTCKVLKGHYLNMLSQSETEAKFRDCARHAPFPLDEDRQNAIIADVRNFEHITPEKLFRDMRP